MEVEVERSGDMGERGGFRVVVVKIGDFIGGGFEVVYIITLYITFIAEGEKKYNIITATTYPALSKSSPETPSPNSPSLYNSPSTH